MAEEITQTPVYKLAWGKTRPFKLTKIKWLDGLPVTSFTDWEFWFTVKDSADLPDSAAILQKKLSTGGLFVVRQSINTVITAEESRDLFAPDTIYHFDFQAKSPAGDVDTLVSGRLVFINDITKST